MDGVGLGCLCPSMDEVGGGGGIYRVKRCSGSEFYVQCSNVRTQFCHSLRTCNCLRFK